MKILVTGGCGYKGSVVIPKLVEAGHEIINVDTQWFGNYLDEDPNDLDEDQKAYQAFFKKAMKKFDVESPADFKDEKKKKEFFDYIDKNYKADKESD